MDDKERVTGRTPRAGTVTTTTTELRPTAAREEVRPSPRTVQKTAAPPRLTAMEEQIIRMRYGIAAAPEQRLEFRGQDNEETRVKLAMIEQLTLEAMRARRAPTKKDKIIDKLTKL